MHRYDRQGAGNIPINKQRLSKELETQQSLQRSEIYPWSNPKQLLDNDNVDDQQ
jgi:hypothetical protein